MSGYVRQSVANIVPGEVVRAEPLNNEFNAIKDAFVLATGHKHDGTTAEGAYVPLISDTNARNKVSVNAGTNSVDVSISVGGVGTQQLSFKDGVIEPTVTDDIDLGSTTKRFNNGWITTLTGTTATYTTVSATNLTGVSTLAGTTITATGAFNFTGATVTVAAPTTNSNPATKLYVDNAIAVGGILPTQTGNAGRFLTTNGTASSWADVYPTQTGNAGTFLTTNGTSVSWSAVLPTQTGNAGRFLTTNGTSASWAQVYPAQTGNDGLPLVTDGTNASWGLPHFAHIGLVANGIY